MQLWRTYFFSSCACPSRLLTMFWCQIGHLDWFGVAPFRQEKDGEATIFRNYRDKGSKVKTTGIHITSHALMHLSRCIIVKLYLALPQTTRQRRLIALHSMAIFILYVLWDREERGWELSRNQGSIQNSSRNGCKFVFFSKLLRIERSETNRILMFSTTFSPFLFTTVQYITELKNTRWPFSLFLYTTVHHLRDGLCVNLHPGPYGSRQVSS